MMIFDVEVVLTFAFLLSLTFATTSSFLSVGIFVVILGLDLIISFTQRMSKPWLVEFELRNVLKVYILLSTNSYTTGTT